MPTSNVVPFPKRLKRDNATGIRVAYVTPWWWVERLADGVVTVRNRMPTQADAVRIASRVSRRDKALLLPMVRVARPFGQPGPDAA